MRWTSKEQSRAGVAALAGELGISCATATLLHALGLKGAAEARRFMNPMLRELDDPFRITNMEAAIERVIRALRKGESVVVFGDYDVDGVTSTVLLLDLLNSFGLYPRYLVPRRMDEGYGLSRTALERLLEGGRPDLLIAVDCGTNSGAEVAWLRELGVDIIILDHHTSRDEGSAENQAILVNPHLFDGEQQPWSQLCTVGLTFKFAHALIKRLRDEGDECAHKLDLREYLDLVALGTVADLVPLLDENRILAKRGMERMQSPRRTGLEALFEVSGMLPDQPVTPFDLSFRLSPRINASGRLAEASSAVDLLMGKDWLRCIEIAQELDRMNRERQDIEREIAAQAMNMVEESYADDAALVLHSPDWHPGVVGIVASRVAGQYQRPAIVLGSEEGGLFKGSGRSAGGIDLVAAIQPCAELLKTWGGHPMAVGVTMEAEYLDAFRKAFARSVASQSGSASTEATLEIACWVQPEELNENLFRELEALGPYGQGNPQPLIGIRGLRVPFPASLFGSGHCRFSVDIGRGQLMSCVHWRCKDRMPPTNKTIDIVARLTWNVWKGQRTPQFQIEDWAETGNGTK